jgi:hypothetical protein
VKICTKCRVEKPKSDYFVRDKRTNRLHAQCKECYALHRKTYYTEHYSKYGDLYRARARERHAQLRQELRKNMIHYLSGKSCEICGEDDPRTLDFDHIDPAQKSFGIARAIANCFAWTIILAEIEKCRILCANCHRKHTATQQGWYR